MAGSRFEQDGGGEAMTNVSLYSLEAVYALTGVTLLIFALMTFADRTNPRRVGSGLFWLTLGIIFMFGGVAPHWLTGLLVVFLVSLDGFGKVSRGRSETDPVKRAEHARRLGNRIFIPVLAIPISIFAFALIFYLFGLNTNHGALVGVGAGGLAAMFLCLKLTSGGALSLMNEGRRLNEAMGAVNILPQLLASLGVIFTAAGVGSALAGAIQQIIPADNLFLLVLANCLGMALFTAVMGNTFAAFPVIATGVLVPLIVKPFGVNPAMAAIITLTAGSSGTLMTPMAANYNIVPAALLEMRDQYGVIKFQIPYALTLWSFHVLLLWLLIKVS
jgi:uncharacterized membrane protein